jgi:hypothetical protein
MTLDALGVHDAVLDEAATVIHDGMTVAEALQAIISRPFWR